MEHAQAQAGLQRAASRMLETQKLLKLLDEVRCRRSPGTTQARRAAGNGASPRWPLLLRSEVELGEEAPGGDAATEPRQLLGHMSMRSSIRIEAAHDQMQAVRMAR